MRRCRQANGLPEGDDGQGDLRPILSALTFFSSAHEEAGWEDREPGGFAELEFLAELVTRATESNGI